MLPWLLTVPVHAVQTTVTWITLTFLMKRSQNLMIMKQDLKLYDF